MLQYVVSNQGLHCLPVIQQLLDTLVSKLYVFKFKNKYVLKFKNKYGKELRCQNT